MKGTIVLSLATAASAAASHGHHKLDIRAANSTLPCASGVHMLVARGSTEAPGLGRIGVVAGNVSALVPGSTIEPVDYPATFENYSDSEAKGAAFFTKSIVDYTALCPKTKIVLLGYSQGAQAVMDSLCGNSESGFTVSADLPGIYDEYLAAVLTYGDPSHTVGAPWNFGTSNKTGIFPRLNITACEPYSDQIRGYCDTGDVYCDRGNNSATHGSYFKNYTKEATEWIVAKYTASLAAGNVTIGGGHSDNTTVSVPSSPSSTGASTPASSSSSTPTSASGTPVPTSAVGSMRPSFVAGVSAVILSVMYMAL
ncbi:cutinase-domain-containing protein [Podospora didyma]|uniref:Cutinase-domain-containing protein n=1 Tax=Podospora didyma TaxID=330526 RepID=A0AAE0NYI0_9PEZI|nr:cutinase-domain-containing protein [Podospora didyma]